MQQSKTMQILIEPLLREATQIELYTILIEMFENLFLISVAPMVYMFILSTQKLPSCEKRWGLKNLGEKSCEIKSDGQQMAAMILILINFNNAHSHY